MSRDSKNQTPVEGIVTSNAASGSAGWRGRLKWLLPLVALVLILVAGGLWWWLNGDSQPAKPTAAEKQRQQLLESANFKTAPEKNDQLAAIVAKMQHNPACDEDPSCLYVETIYYINKGDAGQAGQAYDKFKQVYQPDQPLDPSLKAALQSRPISGLDDSIAYLQQRLQQARQNSRGS